MIASTDLANGLNTLSTKDSVLPVLILCSPKTENGSPCEPLLMLEIIEFESVAFIPTLFFNGLEDNNFSAIT